MRSEILRRSVLKAFFLGTFFSLSGCENTGKISAEKATQHMEYVATAAKRDAEELVRGMPQGAEALTSLFQEAFPEIPSAAAAREALMTVRSKNNDLDSAKSTFFLVTSADGTILRNNLDQDEMAGKNLFEVYADAAKKKKDGYFQFQGSWEVARGVNHREDAQRGVAVPIKLKGDTVGYFVSGWSWSSYAYRLETSLRSEILQNTKSGDKVPLVYVYVLVGSKAYGAPVSPVVNGKAIQELSPLEKTKGGEVFATPIEIERRQFGVALRHMPELGDDVVIAVLRSET